MSIVRLRIRCYNFLAELFCLWKVLPKKSFKGLCVCWEPSSLSDHQNTSCQLFPSPPHPSLHRARERVAWQRRVWIRSRWRRGVTASVSAGIRAFLLSQRPASQNTSTARAHTHTHTHRQCFRFCSWLDPYLTLCMKQRERKMERPT